MKDKIIYLPIGILTGATALSAVVLSGAGAMAEIVCTTDGNGVRTCTGAQATASVTVSDACSFYNTSDSTASLTATNGTYYTAENTAALRDVSTMTGVCNNPGGLAIYAIGDSTNVAATRNQMTGASSGQNIATKVYANGDTTSSWAMKLTGISGTYTPTIDNSFDSYHVVPNSYVKVAHYTPQTAATAGVQIKTSYAIYVSPTQAADTYTGKVKYTLVNPATAAAPTE